MLGAHRWRQRHVVASFSPGPSAVTISRAMLALLPHTPHLPGARGALGREHTVRLLGPLPCPVEGVRSQWKGRGSCGCVLSEGRGRPGVTDGSCKHSKHLHSLRPTPSLKEPHIPIGNSAIPLAHNLRKRAKLLTSGAPCPDLESTLKRRPSPGLPSQAVNWRRHIH